MSALAITAIVRLSRSKQALLSLAAVVVILVSSACADPNCPGNVGCDCTFDGMCGEENMCLDGICAPGPCAFGACVDQGDPGGACYPNGTCNIGALCTAGACVACDAGSELCGCYGNATCDDGLTCAAGVCTGPFVNRKPPENPKCFSPCRSSFTRDDGSYANCDADGLMEGCRGDNVCVDGSCIPGAPLSTFTFAVGECANDLECPDYQTCIEGQCYSNCDTNAECLGQAIGDVSFLCHRHVCRQPCDSATPCAEPGTYCDATTGQSGYCMAGELPSGEAVTPPGVFYLSDRRFELSNVRVSTSFFIVNESPVTQTFTVTKSAGNELVEGSPLHWIEMGCLDGCLSNEIGLAQTQSFTLTLDGNGAAAEIGIAEAANENLPAWTGTISVTSSMGARDVTLSYVSQPDGQWSGRMFYFANFPNKEIGTWVADHSTTTHNNAFLVKWTQFVNGQISLDEFEAVVSSTQTESWRSPLMRSDEYCPDPNTACYPYDNQFGYGVYSQSLATKQVPTGGNELPMVVNLTRDLSDDTALTGRIETAQALHFPGNPAVEIAFATSPTACPTNGQGVTLCQMETFAADVLVGGRYLTDADGTGCAFGANDGAGSTYALHKTPWLVPGFKKNTVFEAELEKLYRYECRDPLLPLTNADGSALTSAQMELNLSSSEANPIPDGRTRVRRLRMLDGVMVNQTDMVIIFEESFESFLGDTDDSGFSAYGLLRLRRVPAQLEADAFVGNDAVEDRTFSEGLLDVTCADTLLSEVEAQTGSALDPTNAVDAALLAELLVNGAAAPPNAPVLFSAQANRNYVPGEEVVHWLCEETGLIDGGPNEDIPCPGGSRIRFFTATGQDADGLDHDSCNSSFVAESVSVSTSISYKKCKSGEYPCNCIDEPNTCETCSPQSNLDPDATVSPEDACYPAIKDSNFSLWDVRTTTPGTCQARLNALQQDDNTGNADNVRIRFDPAWRCAPLAGNPAVRPDSCTILFESSGTPVVDARRGKDFYPKSESLAAFSSLRDAVADAFRYKTQFRSRSGKTIGFSPEVCIENSNQIPYCYDPKGIEKILDRVDCVANIYTAHHASAAFDELMPGSNNLTKKEFLRQYLALNFAYDEMRFNPLVTGELLPVPIVTDGFERLNTELLVMLGDEALTRAFASRFDLAGTNLSSFEGTLFEPGGIDLSGGAGFELYTLYQSVQYYQLALDRFYKLSPLIWNSLSTLGGTDQDGFIDGKTVTAYFERLIRASTQKARAMSEISSRYRDFNEPALARRVVERAYTSTYLESIVLSRMMLRLDELNVDVNAVQQIRATVERAQLTYRSALLRMRDTYASISDNRQFFGFAPEYIPFPAIDTGEGNAFEIILASVRDKLAVASDKEDLALEQNRAFEVDAAAFQAELVDVRNNYENQLAEICGTFESNAGGEVQVLPAIRKYAHLSEIGRLAGDPCGLVNTGSISESIVELNIAQLDMQSAVQAVQDLEIQIKAEAERVEQQCNLIVGSANFNFQVDSQVNAYNDVIRTNEAIKEEADRMIGQMSDITNLAACVTGVADNCITSAVAAAVLTIGYVAFNITAIATSIVIAETEDDIEELEASAAYWNTLQECNYAIVQSNYDTRVLILQEKHLQIEALKAMENVNLALSRIESLRNEAKRLQDQQDEAQQLTINIEAARNDPNVRIYKNDAIITADRTFERALREAYRLTKVYEYYTSTSYAYLGDLFLVRLVSRGDISLESYVDQLEDAFSSFEEEYGNPDPRALIVSLKDDIFNVPRVDENELALSSGQRDTLFREMLFDVARLDDDGYISVSFPITLERLSPLTRNHKIDTVEIEMLGNEVDGDGILRAYLRQRGTGVVRSVMGDKLFYGFPKRTAVVNAYTDGKAALGVFSNTYVNRRLKDRPLANTQWELVINFQDEIDNLDIDKTALSDVRVFYYYTDFTEL
jgi:hypothetical protein